MEQTNTVEELVTIQKQNQELLKIIAESQAMMLELARKNQALEKQKLWIGAGKYLIWIVLIWVSFVFTQKLTQGLMGGGGTNTGMDTQNVSSVLDGLLNGGVDSELQSELDRYMGN